MQGDAIEGEMRTKDNENEVTYYILTLLQYIYIS